MAATDKVPGMLITERHLFAAVFDVSPEWRLPEDFKVTRYGGMRLCQRLRTKTGQDIVLTWWTDAASFTAVWSDDVAQELKLLDKPRFSGTTTEQQPSEPRKKWLPWMVTFLAGTVAVLGNFTQLENYGAWLLATPRAKILTSELPTRVIQGQLSAIEFKIHNLTKGSCRIGELTAEVTPADALRFDHIIGPLTPLEPGELRSITWPVIPLTPGRHEITLLGEAKAGRMQAGSKLAPAVAKIDVWEQLERKPRLRLQHFQADMAVFVLEVHHGNPLTKTIAYQANGPAGLEFTDVNPNSEKQVTDHQSGAAAIAWKQDATPLVPQVFKLFVRPAKPLGESDWRRYEKEIQIDAAFVQQ